MSRYPPSGKRLDVPQLAVWRFEEGKAKDFWQRSDETGMVIQMGIIPERGTNPLLDIAFITFSTMRMGVRQARYKLRSRHG